VLAVSLEEVQTNFERYGLLDDQVRFLKGWFRDTLPAAPIERLAVLRLDDMYQSTMDALANLYLKVSQGATSSLMTTAPSPPAARQFMTTLGLMASPRTYAI
jgi:Macrocin-O-methyltransferase (TylF)